VFAFCNLQEAGVAPLHFYLSSTPLAFIVVNPLCLLPYFHPAYYVRLVRFVSVHGLQDSIDIYLICLSPPLLGLLFLSLSIFLLLSLTAASTHVVIK
jgi:hypothetical protein